MELKRILARLPYSAPFLFVDSLLAVDEKMAEGTYRFKETEFFYQGHFTDHPVTPGVILTECCAQIGLVAMGIFLLEKGGASLENVQIAMSSSQMDFYLPVYPLETVTVKSDKIYFRFQKLKCEVKMYNSQGKLVCKGTLSGMLKMEINE
ncbi:3-hydroxyacyl-[acyl-carrier-protein] dehydratase FabZ [Arenibacter antarcticus]|uniref:3-hydroxyacyl-ACP dehydratase FabZ family protein n=1 Tax=Arenibacter antarcticus TaxID=2040469 RepID=A0ABW5VFZ6_9FLAO|nr:hydroxymyristoyl-ACP dehydratase [Arenibacter sp. H213]MCM4166383.1 hydroxymyristoyl-ACP dehydratase [Arenibacter sp. H213]